MASSLLVKIIALIYGALGLTALIDGIVLLTSKVSLPLSAAAITYGIFSVSLTLPSTLGLIPVVFGLVLITLAVGLFYEVDWALWLTIGLNVIILLITGLTWIALAFVQALPIIGSFVNFPWWEFAAPVVIFAALTVSLFAKRDDFS